MEYQVNNKQGNYILRYEEATGKLIDGGLSTGFSSQSTFLDTTANNTQKSIAVEEMGYVDLPLYIVTNLEPSYQRAIIIKESATGDAGYVIDNGRLQKSITINGELLASTNEELMKYENDIRSLQGKVIQLIPNKFSSLNTSNKYFIQNFSPVYSNSSDVSINFTMVLQEFREVNVGKTSLSLSESNLALIASATLGMLEPGANDETSQITWEDTTFTNSVNKLTRRFGLQVAQKNKSFYDSEGRLIESKFRGFTVDSDNNVINTVLNLASGVNIWSLGTLEYGDIAGNNDSIDTEVVILDDGSSMMVAK